MIEYTPLSAEGKARQANEHGHFRRQIPLVVPQNQCKRFQKFVAYRLKFLL